LPRKSPILSGLEFNQALMPAKFGAATGLVVDAARVAALASSAPGPSISKPVEQIAPHRIAPTID